MPIVNEFAAIIAKQSPDLGRDLKQELDRLRMQAHVWAERNLNFDEWLRGLQTGTQSD
jgi:hypothetical protein